MLLKKDFPLGVIVYEGQSQIDGKPIVAIATGFKSNENSKIGNMLQVWIIRSDIHPQDALTDHEDFSICGDCKHRDFRSCYVRVHHGPLAVYNAYKRGCYVKGTFNTLKFFKNKDMRIGAYGDPAAVPTYIWASMCKIVSVYTGYTHQWRKCDPALKNFCMASVETEKEYYLAQKKGWRTFRIRISENDPIYENEMTCPASKEAGKVSTCDKCRSCNGIVSANKKNITIIIHGWRHKVNYFKQGIKKIRNKKKYRVIKNPKPVTIKEVLS